MDNVIRTRTDILREVEGLVKSENPVHPYTDIVLLNLLKTRGYEELNRRDVALARSELGIFPSAYRKKD